MRWLIFAAEMIPVKIPEPRQTDVPRAIPLVGPKRYSDVLRMPTTSKITGTPVSKVYFD